VFERWMGACGGAPISAGCLGVAFRFSAPTQTFTTVLRVHAHGVTRAFLDGKPLADGRAELALGSHVLAVECGGGPFAVVANGIDTRSTRFAAVRAVTDGNVAAAANATGAWTALDGGASFAPVLEHAPSSGMPAWTDGLGVQLPAGTRFVRFVFPLVFQAAP
jgi:hypothetical protein